MKAITKVRSDALSIKRSERLISGGKKHHESYKPLLAIASVFLATVLSVPFPVWGQTTGTLTIVADTILTEDHHGNIVIGANGVELDCDGFDVVGSGSGLGILLNNKTNVIVKRCNVSNFFDGFRLQNSDANTLEANTAENNSRFGFFLLFDSDANTLQQNTGRNNGLDGFGLDRNCSDNFLEGNTARDNARAGYTVNFSSSNNTLVENNAENNLGGGFSVASFSENNILRQNTARNNGGNGFGLGVPPRLPANNNILDGNTAKNNDGHGFLISISSGNTFINNRAKNNAADGFFLRNSGGNTLEANKARLNGAFGYRDEFTANTYLDNECKDNLSGGSDPTGLCSPQP